MKVGLGGNARGQEKSDGKDQNLSFFVSSWQRATPLVREGTDNGPA